MVGILADLHDNLRNLLVFFERERSNCAELWLAGDIGTPETVATLCQQFSGPVRLVAGNVEIDHQPASYTSLSADFPNLVWQAQAPLLWSIDRDLSGALFHDPRQARSYAQMASQTVVVTGHSHRPGLEHLGTNWLLNPGTLGGVFTPATYAIATFSPKPHFILKRLYE